VARTWLSIRVDLVEGHGEQYWPRPDNAEERARELASFVTLYAEPYLQGLASDRADLQVAVKASPAFSQPAGGCRLAVLLAQQGHRDQANESATLDTGGSLLIREIEVQSAACADRVDQGW
jgi:hypothetical protein